MKSTNATTFAFSQLVDLLTSMTDQEYIKPLAICNGSSVGMHVRHIVELYQCLLRDQPSGVVDYDNRARNPLLETSIACAKTAIHYIKQQLEVLPHDANLCIVDHEGPKDINTNALAATSLQRELMYNREHCLHHMAIIGMCIRVEFPHIQIHQDFGKANATIRYENSILCVQ